MTAEVVGSDRSLVLRRLDNLRASAPTRPLPAPGARPPERIDRAGKNAAASSPELGEQLADAVEGELVRSARGSYVRIARPGRPLPVDREALARLPGQPPVGAPLLCLDTETTGLATAAGTLAFLVGVGRWTGDRFEQIQLLLPDHADEPALLAALRDLVAPDSWLVTYNGRGFDWPLLVARFRMGREAAPGHAGHVDLLPFVRRVFRHRLSDARLRTVERELLALSRDGDVDGWEIPGRYLAFLHRGQTAGLLDVVRHNEEDVRSLARLLAHVARELGDPAGRRRAPGADLAGLARAYRRERREAEALACLDDALARPFTAQPPGDWDAWGVAAERARVLRRLRRHDEALAAWEAIAGSNKRLAAVAWVEVAKLREHVRRDLAGAWSATEAAARIGERARLVGRPLHGLEADLRRRRRRLAARLARESDRRAVRPPSAGRTPVTRRSISPAPGGPPRHPSRTPGGAGLAPCDA